MTLALPDRWIWDFWIADVDGHHHAVYLQAPRSLGNPDLRHRNATNGHAVSTDLRHWQVLPDALGPGRPGAWDDLATWTGIITRDDDRWYLFYTGVSSGEDGQIQRIGLATSDDLLTWERHGDNPLIEADERWYETGTVDWYEEAWRDPWVFASGGRFHALITARANSGPSDGRGVIGHATSTNLVDWEVGPPRSRPGEFGHLEVPQLVDLVGLPGDHLLVFSCDRARISSQRRRRVDRQRDAVYTVPTADPLGPYDIEEATEALPDGLYSGRIVRQSDGTLHWLAFLDATGDREFVGELSDPIPYPWPGHQAST